MRFYPIQCSPLLADYVRYFWVLEGDIAASSPYTHRTMASGCPELCFHYKGSFDELLADDHPERSFTSGLHGQTQHFRRFRTAENFGLFGAFLYPYAVPVLLGIPAEEINNQMVDLPTLLGPSGRNLEEQMMLADSNTGRARILSAFLEGRLANAKTSRILPAIRQVIHTRGQLPIGALSDQFYLSDRQFERVFKQYAGVSPKLFSRLLRFENALGAYGGKSRSLTEIAYDCGYYDQSHFIHEFREFSGHHPRHYFSGEAEGSEWKEAGD